MYTSTHSDLFWKIHKIHHKGEKYVKLKMTVFYKSNGNICQWFNPTGRAKNFKVLREKFDHYIPYTR